ncbi:GIY-YIG nuclease family protein [Hymenobacter properus]|uniref:GIY-YIG nuclease family protein n=1 Tax=Hymenobacter properus TaxID=2791026 RepID=A0A931BJG3_9BACT|nr:GIY-YIG nuclease family protein [Hymenobacter properus]MBF9143417.1 GIY-YIG nuclease family protein [Hymenobacter properus]MBR7722230.1 GIY-YIG nuclease family protein [Microvirga sp. SRT04]
MSPSSQQPTQLSVVYVLTNPAMPGMVKIGRTSHDDAKTRIDQLYTTGVPVPFNLEFVCKVPNSEEVEKALHQAFAPHRVNPKREFFTIEASQAIVILKLLHVQDATVEIENQPTAISISQSEVNAGTQLKKKRPPLNFTEMQIPPNSELICKVNAAVAIVLDSKRVQLNGEEMSLTAATRKVLNIDYSVAPSPYWSFDGQLLQEIYNNTYGQLTDE